MKTPVPGPNFIKKETLAQVFYCEFCKISKNTFCHRTPPVTASVELSKAVRDFSSPGPMFFIKLNFKISQIYVTLINDFDKTFVLAFYNSFLRIKLNCDKKNMSILNICSFQKNMLSNLTWF